MHIISQLRPGADLSRVVLPTFILEPRSMLERVTKYAPRTNLPCMLMFQELTVLVCSFMCHPEMLLPIPELNDPTERFVSVVKFYLTGWHIRPPSAPPPPPPSQLFPTLWFLTVSVEASRSR